MKKILYIAILSSLSFLQCTDLALSPEDAFTEEQIFQDVDAYRSYLAKAYASYSLTGQDGPNGSPDVSIVNDEGFTSYIRAYWKAQECTTDEAVLGWTDAGIRDLHEHSWSSENQFVRVLYYRIALIVSICNDFISQSSEEKLSTNGLSESDKEVVRQYNHEARFLRALAYWHSLDLFRNVPLVTSITAEPPVQAEPIEVFNFIQSELADLENLLPAPRQHEYGRADQGALWMLQAKLYLNAEVMVGENHYADCITACEKVINAGYSLEPNYIELFMKDNHESNEIIFALASDGKQSQSWGCTTFLVNAALGGTMDSEDWGVTSGGWAGLRTTSVILDKYPDLTGSIDSRSSFFWTEGHSVEIDDIGVYEQGIAAPKYSNANIDGVAGSDPTHCDTDYPMFRLADAHLMYAEAVLRGGGGDMGTAATYVNQLRERAYGDASGNITESDLTLSFILDERVRELFWEATRRVDLVRFGQFTTEGIWPWKGNVKEGRLTEAHRDIFPIPASDLLANPNLNQNDGY